MPSVNSFRQHDKPLGEALGEPYRYVCPSCGSVQVVPRRSYNEEGRGQPAGGPYYCEAHGGPLDAVYDKKTGTEEKP